MHTLPPGGDDRPRGHRGRSDLCLPRGHRHRRVLGQDRPRGAAGRRGLDGPQGRSAVETPKHGRQGPHRRGAGRLQADGVPPAGRLQRLGEPHQRQRPPRPDHPSHRPRLQQGRGNPQAAREAGEHEGPCHIGRGDRLDKPTPPGRRDQGRYRSRQVPPGERPHRHPALLPRRRR